MARHVLVREPADWHCFCCSKNFPLTEKPPEEECPVYTRYLRAAASIKPLPEIKDLKSWNTANAILRDDLEILLRLDEEMSDGFQATKRRFPIQ